MKRWDFTCSDWKCIIEKEFKQKYIEIDGFCGYVTLLNIKKVDNPQIWKFNGEDVVVCQDNYKWIAMLPKNAFYCVTAMLDENDTILLWYVDMIASQELDEAGKPFYYDLYLDLVVYPDGTIIEDDRDELEEALHTGDITKEQFALANVTAEELKSGILTDIKALSNMTHKCRKCF